MEDSLRIVIFISALLLCIVVLQLLRRGRIPVKFSILWGVVIIALFIVSIIPNALIFFMNLIGFQTLSNMLIGIMFAVLFFMMIALTVIVSGQKTKIQLLIQEVSMLKDNKSLKDK